MKTIMKDLLNACNDKSILEDDNGKKFLVLNGFSDFKSFTRPMMVEKGDYEDLCENEGIDVASVSKKLPYGGTQIVEGKLIEKLKEKGYQACPMFTNISGDYQTISLDIERIKKEDEYLEDHLPGIAFVKSDEKLEDLVEYENCSCQGGLVRIILQDFTASKIIPLLDGSLKISPYARKEFENLGIKIQEKYKLVKDLWIDPFSVKE